MYGRKMYKEYEHRLTGWDSNFEVKCSNFKSRYKWNIYLALNNMY